MTHSSSSTVKLSRDTTEETNADTAGGINTCVAMVTDGSLRNRKYQSDLLSLCSHICRTGVFPAQVSLLLLTGETASLTHNLLGLELDS